MSTTPTDPAPASRIEIAPQAVHVTRRLSNSARQRRRVGKITTYALLTVFGLLFAFPLFWTASSSLQTWQELRSYVPHLLPETPQWGNYTQVFSLVPFARWMLNSLTIILINIPGTILTATLTAYAFARFNFVGKNVWFVLMLSTMMIPAIEPMAELMAKERSTIFLTSIPTRLAAVLLKEQARIALPLMV